jgi:flavodoxin
MTIDQVRLIYFSPTGTTRKVLESIAEGIGAEVVGHIDLTLPAGLKQPIAPVSGGIAVIGAPVYGGRLPADAIDRFKQVTADGVPAVLVVVYGNREFEDALLELKDLSLALGFIPVAGGAFVGEHSFARSDLPIANGRPDRRDLQKAKDFGEKAMAKIAALPSPEARMDLDLPGRFPYEGGVRSMAVSPV